MPDIWYDVDVALAEVPVNIAALISDSDFKTRDTGIAYNETNMDLVWNFVTTAGAFTQTAVTPTTSGDYDWAHQGDGMYSIEIPASGGASINNTAEGVGWFSGLCDAVLPWRGPTCGFRAAAINDALIDSDTLIDNKDNQLLYESTIGTATSQTEFIMDTAFAVNDTWIGNTISLEDVSTGESYSGNRWISDSIQSTETLEINVAFPVTVVAGDKIRIYAAQHPTYAIETYDAATGTEAATILAKLLAYFQLALRKDAAIANDNSVELTALNADEASGAGAYDNTTDALEATQDDITTVKAKTDDLTFTVANVVDANVTNFAGGTDLTTSGTGGQKYGES